MKDQTHMESMNNSTEIDDMAKDQPQAPETPQEETPEMEDDMQAKIAELEAQVQANLEGWQRSRAEFTNYRRRTQQELAESRERGSLEALSKMLPIIDDFDRALANIPEELQDHPWLNGTALILKNMQKVLDDYQIESIDPVGEEFDPNYHEAIGMDESDEYDAGIVTTTLQKGYRSGERVLRPALVRVAS